MSRLGDLILTERTRQHLTRKQVARKCGVSEGYLKDVEEGRRIIQDDQARRILLTLGTSSRNEASFSLDEIAATVDLSTLAPQTPEKKAAPAEPQKKPVVQEQTHEDQHGIWLDALSSVLKPVPIMNAGWIETGRRMLPIQDGKIEGVKPDKIVYFKAPDDSMQVLRILKNDLVLVALQSLPLDNAVMLVEYGAHRCLRQVKLLGNGNLLLQSGSRSFEAETVHINDIKIVGRALRVEFDLSAL